MVKKDWVIRVCDRVMTGWCAC